MKILGQIVAVEPLALIVSLPNQLFAHVPITHISTQLTQILETMDDVEMHSSDDEEDDASREDREAPPDPVRETAHVHISVCGA